MIIAIDGPAGSGKSSVAKSVAQRLGFRYLDTGAMYRAVAFRALESGIPLEDARVSKIAEEDRIEFVHEEGEPLPSRVLIGGEDVTEAIRTHEVDSAVSIVAKSPGVRAAMVEQQRLLGHEVDIVVEGRDIGSVVFPDADVKVFLTASPEERARRRAAQRAETGETVDESDIHEAIVRRDRLDSTRDVSPLRQPADSVAIDSTGREFEEVVDAVVALAEAARRTKGGEL